MEKGTNKYKGTSVVDFLKSANQDSSFQSRRKMAVEQGIVQKESQYVGSAQQNTSLLNKLQTATPTAPEEVNTKSQAERFINESQDRDIQNITRNDEPPVRRKDTAQSLIDAFKEATGKSGLIPDMSLPEAPKFEDMFQDLRRKHGIDALETVVDDLDAQEQDLQAQLRQATNTEIGKPVALNVIEGRVGEQERNFMERIDFVQRQKSRAINELQNANDTIENIMNFRKMDYDVAREQYNQEFSQNIQLFNVFKGLKEYENTVEERERQNARSNLQIIYNSIRDGGMDVDALPQEKKTRINKLEIQAGLPQDFFNNIAVENPNGKILSTTTRSVNGAKYADVVSQNKDGSLRVESIMIGSVSSGGSGGGITGSDEPSVSWDQYLAAAQEEVAMSISPNTDVYNDLYESWKRDFGTVNKTSGEKFTKTQKLKLEQAGLIGATRSEQLDFLYGEEPDDEDDSADFSREDKLKLEQGNMQNASRQEQLDYLYGGTISDTELESKIRSTAENADKTMDKDLLKSQAKQQLKKSLNIGGSLPEKQINIINRTIDEVYDQYRRENDWIPFNS